MKGKGGGWELSSPRLEDLRGALQRARQAPCTETQLQGAGFDGPAVAMLIGMPAHHADSLVVAVLAERTAHPRPQLDLVWSGPEAAQAQSRDTGQVLRELFESAERHVIVAGFAFWGGARSSRRSTVARSPSSSGSSSSSTSIRPATTSR